jgi:hypothetical protein
MKKEIAIWSRIGEVQGPYTILFGNLERKIILKWVLKKYCMRF